MAYEFGDIYYPTISLRPAEILAMSKLTEEVKNSFLPIFLLRPWGNSLLLQNATDKLTEHFEGRPYALDIDMLVTGSPRTQAGIDFESLKNPDNGFNNWREYISLQPNAIPIVQTYNDDVDVIATQVDAFSQRELGYVYRFVAGSSVSGFSAFLRFLNESSSAEPFTVILDAGWTEDASFSELFLKRHIELISEYGDRLTLIIALSSFPRNFSFIDGVAAYPILSREVFSRIRRSTNLPRVYYGDWASTRPSAGSSIMSPPLPRIDIAMKDRWISARKKKPRWDLQMSAKAVTNLPEWDTIPPVWGRHFVEAVRDGEVQDVNATGFSANAARISMHILMQSNYENDVQQISLDEPWIDTI